MTPDEYAAIKAHLYMSPPVNGVQYQSSFIAVLGDTRSAAERNPDGVVLPGRLSMSWLAATGYLVLLDQIGTCFETQGKQTIADNNSIIRALKYFSHVQDDPTLGALVALRNALTHDYGLYNRDDRYPLRHHAFNYGADEMTPLVQLPKKRWSGRWDINIPEEETTIVNLRKVGDLAEEVVDTLRSNHKAPNLGAAASTARVPNAVRDVLSRCLTPRLEAGSGCDRFVLAATPEPVQKGSHSIHMV